LHFTCSNFRLKDVPMKHYHHLTQESRYLIAAEKRIGKSHQEIAAELGCSRQTIWREMQRNTGKRGYRPKQAHHQAKVRRSQASVERASITGFGLAFIAHKLSGDEKWSPEQIHGGLITQGWTDVPSHEWIYQHIYLDKQAGGDLHTHLRCQKTYRKRSLMGNDRRGQIPNRLSIHLRPQVVEARSRLGDIEGDTIIGRHHKGAVLTLLERKSLYVWLRPLVRRSATNTAQACIEALDGVKPYSITFDNGKEFAQHVLISSATGADIYFADPYCSNQRARNENGNGLARQYFPKYMCLDQLDAHYVARVQTGLNARPRKTLGWKTPAQVLSGF
jgi:IS30 family transposase